MEAILETKKYSAMSEKELLAEAERLSQHEDKTVAGFGRTVKKCILNKFIDINEFFSAVNTVLFVGGPALSICIGVIIGVTLLITTLVPFVVIAAALNAQEKFLKTRLKWTDPNALKYRELSKEIRKRHIRVTTEGLQIVTEAPKEEIVPDDTNDYTDDVDEDDENTPEEEPEDTEEPTDDGGDEPVDDTEPVNTDYTEDEDLAGDTGEEDTTGDTDTTAEDEPLDPNAEDDTATDDTTEEDPEADTTEDDMTDDTTDYTEDEGMDGGEDTGDTTDDTVDDTTTDDMGGQDEEQSQNSIVKNYNLMIDFKRLYTTTSDILSRLGDVVFKNPIQNQVLDRCVQNIQKISEQVLNYMEFTFSTKYEDNLYHYNIFVQALKLNLEIMKKNNQLGDIDENS